MKNTNKLLILLLALALGSASVTVCTVSRRAAAQPVETRTESLVTNGTLALFRVLGAFIAPLPSRLSR